MKAITWEKYGPAEVLEYKEIEKPIPKENEVLIKIHTATVTAGDCETRSLKFPYWIRIPLRFYLGYFKPKKNVLGQEMAGEIVAVGKGVSAYKVGDKVFGGSGMRYGAYAEFKRHPASNPLAIKPKGISYEAAATLIVGGINSLHFLRLANIQAGQKVLICGATGSIGSYAVQIAKLYGADVTAVCGTPNLDLIKSLGADRVIDYMMENYQKRDEKYDVILEAVGKTSFSGGLRCLNKGGILILANPRMAQLLKSVLLDLMNIILFRRNRKKVIVRFAGENIKDLDYLAELIEIGKIKPLIDRRFSLEQMVEAHKYVEKGQKVGHVIINVVK